MRNQQSGGSQGNQGNKGGGNNQNQNQNQGGNIAQEEQTEEYQTKMDGTPDQRFKDQVEQRDGTTVEGKPDHRFKENLANRAENGENEGINNQGGGGNQDG